MCGFGHLSWDCKLSQRRRHQAAPPIPGRDQQRAYGLAVSSSLAPQLPEVRNACCDARSMARAAPIKALAHLAESRGVTTTGRHAHPVPGKEQDQGNAENHYCIGKHRTSLLTQSAGGSSACSLGADHGDATNRLGRSGNLHCSGTRGAHTPSPHTLIHSRRHWNQVHSLPSSQATLASAMTYQQAPNSNTRYSLRYADHSHVLRWLSAIRRFRSIRQKFTSMG